MVTSSTVAPRIQTAQTLSHYNRNMDIKKYPDSFSETQMKKVMKQQEAIRTSGMINMFDIDGVQRIAADMGSAELVSFIEAADTDQYFDMAEEARERSR